MKKHRPLKSAISSVLVAGLVATTGALGATSAQAAPATVNVSVSCAADTNVTANFGDTLELTFGTGCTADSHLFTWKAWITVGDYLTPTSSGTSVPSSTVLTKTFVEGNAALNPGDAIAFVVPDIYTASQSSSFAIRWQGARPLDSATPTISSQPAGASKTEGDSLSLSVTASASDGGTLSYQWKKDGSNLSGKTAATLSIPSLVTSDAGSYTVEVTNTHNSDTPASVTSNAAVVTVDAAATTPPTVDPADTTPPTVDAGDSKTYTSKPITFSVGTSILTSASKKNLKASVTAAGKSAEYTITGSAGKLPGVSDKAVKALAMKRANVLKAYLVQLGVSKSSITIKTKIVKQGVKPKTSVLALY